LNTDGSTIGKDYPGKRFGTQKGKKEKGGSPTQTGGNKRSDCFSPKKKKISRAPIGGDGLCYPATKTDLPRGEKKPKGKD